MFVVVFECVLSMDVSKGLCGVRIQMLISIH